MRGGRDPSSPRLELLRDRLVAGLRVRGAAGLFKVAALALAVAALVAAARRARAGRAAAAVLVALALVEGGLRTSLAPSDGVVTPAQLDSAARPGDVLLCRSYRSQDLFELLVFRWLAALVGAGQFHTHAGIVVERGGRKFVLDSVLEPTRSALTGRVKESGVTMRPLAAWAEAYHGRVRLLACERLRAAVDARRLLAYADSIRDQPFTDGLGRGMSCVDAVHGALADQRLFARPPRWRVLTPGHLADPGRYVVPGVRFRTYVVDNAWRRRQ